MDSLGMLSKSPMSQKSSIKGDKDLCSSLLSSPSESPNHTREGVIHIARTDSQLQRMYTMYKAMDDLKKLKQLTMGEMGKNYLQLGRKTVF